MTDDRGYNIYTIHDRARQEPEEPQFLCIECFCAIEEADNDYCDDCWKKLDDEAEAVDRVLAIKEHVRGQLLRLLTLKGGERASED